MRFIGGEYDIEAHIEYVDDGTRLREHKSKQRAPEDRPMGYQQTKGYLEMEEGKEFRICLKVHKPAPRVNDLSIRLFVDGRNFHSEIYEYDEEEEYERCKVYMTGADGQQTTGRLQFSAMAKTDEEAEADVPKDRIDELCSIVLLITEGKSISDGRMAVQTDSSIGKVYEKNLKLASTISMTDVKPASYQYASKFQISQKVCSFVWKYYTRDVLVIKGHIVEAATLRLPILTPTIILTPHTYIRPESRKRAEEESDRLYRQAQQRAMTASGSGEGVSAGDILAAKADLQWASKLARPGEEDGGEDDGAVGGVCGVELLPNVRVPLWGPDESVPDRDPAGPSSATDAAREARMAAWKSLTLKRAEPGKVQQAGEGEVKEKRKLPEKEEEEDEDHSSDAEEDPDKTLVESPVKKMKVVQQADEVTPIVDVGVDVDVDVEEEL